MLIDTHRSDYYDEGKHTVKKFYDNDAAAFVTDYEEYPNSVKELKVLEIRE